MSELLLLSLSLSSPPAELPISVRADMAVKQATSRITQNTPVRAPTSSLLVPSQQRNLHATPLTQPTGVSSNPFVYPPVQQSGGITRVTTAPTVAQATMRPTSFVGMRVQDIFTPVRTAEQPGNTNCST